MIAACIIHDTVKYGWDEFDKAEYKNHARNAAAAFVRYCADFDFTQPHFLLLNAVRSHMGQWSTEREDRPFTSVDRCVHMADYMASRSFIDIPSISEEWEAVKIEEEEKDLPF